MYKKEFKKEVKNEIIQYKYYIGVKDQIDTLYKLINIIIQFDNQLYKCRLEKNSK